MRLATVPQGVVRRLHSPVVSVQAPGLPFTYGGEMSFLAWIVLGLIAGAIAKAIMPGNDPGGIIVTMIIGIVGAFLGGFIGTRVGWGTIDTGTFDFRSVALATIGAIVLLLLGRLVRRS